MAGGWGLGWSLVVRRQWLEAGGRWVEAGGWKLAAGSMLLLFAVAVAVAAAVDADVAAAVAAVAAAAAAVAVAVTEPICGPNLTQLEARSAVGRRDEPKTSR